MRRCFYGSDLLSILKKNDLFQLVNDKSNDNLSENSETSGETEAMALAQKLLKSGVIYDVEFIEREREERRVIANAKAKNQTQNDGNPYLDGALNMKMLFF